HEHQRPFTEWSLFLFFCADPCVALIPMIIAASALGWSAIAAVIVVYEVAMFAMMVTIVMTSLAGARAIRFSWLDRYGDALAGAVILVLGTAFTVFHL
ncbi:MAG TPA: hypothetical protein VM779_10010, partial [Thermoanaerobaculia bacterium]|nr:hypothetical protein [Thermoanaerobaculia bacterium]